MAECWAWLTAQYQRPPRRFMRASAASVQPVKKQFISKILPNVTGLRTDEQLQDFLQRSMDDTVLVSFGSSWCSHCHQMFPHFLTLAKHYPQLKYAVAQVDYMQEGTRGITYTPTFAVYKKGVKVDQFFGANEQQLRDHIWLHTRKLA